jgi:hypothetical protein
MLINSLEQLKKYIPTLATSDFARYSHFMQTAEEYLVSDLIGETLFGKLTAIAANSTANPPVVASTPDPKLLRFCENVVCLKGYLDAIPMLDLVETETGFGVTSNQNVAPASQQRVAALTKGIDIRLSDGIEQLLEYLEGNEDFYDDWKGAKAYTINHDSYIFTLTQFRRYGRYTGSRLEFLQDVSKVTQAIRLKIEPVISVELSAAIIGQLQDNDLNDANKKIIEDLRFSLAAYVTDNEAIANSFLARVRRVLLANADDYPEFKDSEIYTAFLAQISPDINTQSIANFGV